MKKTIETPEELFTHNFKFSLVDKIKFVLFAPLLVPFRLLACLVIAFLIYTPSKIGLLFSDPETRDLKPHTGWRKFFQQMMYMNASYIAMYLLGLQVDVKGKQASRDEAPILIVAPHTSFLDVFIIALCRGSPLARIENQNTVFMWAPQAIGHTIFVNRKNAESRHKAAESIIERAVSPLPWPQIFIFAEGTTSNGQALARFGTGGFQPGLPVQPVTIRYSHPDISVWTMKQNHGIKMSLFLLFCNPWHKVTVEFLPVYTPSEEEKTDPIVYTRNVQQTMASSLQIQATDFTRPAPAAKLKSLNNNKKEE